jgi:hypothetical protein
MKGVKDLTTPKEVMESFLNGDKLINSIYGGEFGPIVAPEVYLYLNEAGFICEEDGAGAKAFRVPITMRDEERWWGYEKK